MKRILIVVLTIILSINLTKAADVVSTEYSRFFQVKQEIKTIIETVALRYIDAPKNNKTQKEIENILVILLTQKAKQLGFTAYVFCDDRNNTKQLQESGVMIFTVEAKFVDFRSQIRWQFSAMMGRDVAQFFMNVEDDKPKTINDLYNWATLYKDGSKME